jgi:uncharacterized protein
MLDSTEQKFVPEATPESSLYWQMAAKHELWLPRCVDTGRFFFPPRETSPYTGGSIAWEKLSGRGTLASYVINHVRTLGFESPYVVALVQLEEGPRMTSNILGVPADPAALRVGMSLQVCFEQRGAMTLPQFAVVDRNARL